MNNEYCAIVSLDVEELLDACDSMQGPILANFNDQLPLNEFLNIKSSLKNYISKRCIDLFA